jgi:hypothetical protein
VVASDSTIALAPYATALVPASCGSCTLAGASGPTKLLAVAPAREGALAARFASAGVAADAGAAFLAQFAARST